MIFTHDAFCLRRLNQPWYKEVQFGTTCVPLTLIVLMWRIG